MTMAVNSLALLLLPFHLEFVFVLQPRAPLEALTTSSLLGTLPSAC